MYIVNTKINLVQLALDSISALPRVSIVNTKINLVQLALDLHQTKQYTGKKIQLIVMIKLRTVHIRNCKESMETPPGVVASITSRSSITKVL